MYISVAILFPHDFGPADLVDWSTDLPRKL